MTKMKVKMNVVIKLSTDDKIAKPAHITMSVLEIVMDGDFMYFTIKNTSQTIRLMIMQITKKLSNGSSIIFIISLIVLQN